MIPIHLDISNCWKALIATEPIVEGNEKALASQYRVKIETREVVEGVLQVIYMFREFKGTLRFP